MIRLDRLRIAATCLLVGASAVGCSRNPIRSADGSAQNDLERALAAYGDRARPVSSAAERPAPGPGAPETQIPENLGRGHREAEAGRPDQAARFYERVLRDDPRHPVAHHRLAVIADQSRDFAAAERHYAAALESRPEDPEVLNDLGYSYLLQGRYPESERTLRDALAFAPSDERALTNLGMLYGTIGDVDRALAVLRLTGSEDEARAKLALLSPSSSRQAASRDAVAPPLAYPAEPDRILQAGATLGPGSPADTHAAGAAVTPEMQDLMTQLESAKAASEHVRRPEPGNLPGLIDPASRPPVRTYGSSAGETAGPQPYFRSRPEPHLAARPAGPRESDSLLQGMPHADLANGGIVNANAESSPSPSPHSRAAGDLPLWSPNVAPVGAQPGQASAERGGLPCPVYGSGVPGEGGRPQRMTEAPSDRLAAPRYVADPASSGAHSTEREPAFGSRGLPPLAYPPAYSPSGPQSYDGGMIEPAAAGRYATAGPSYPQAMTGYSIPSGADDPRLRAYAEDLARRDAEAAEMQRLMQPATAEDPARELRAAERYPAEYGR